MIKKINHIFNSGPLFSVLAIITILLTTAFKPGQPATKVLTLQDEQVHATGKGYFIAAVEDNRTEQKAVAWLMPDAGAGNAAAPQAADLNGGTANAVKRFISKNLPQTPHARLIIVSLKEFKVTESATPDGRVQGKVSIALSFYIRYNEDVTGHLLDYNSGASYLRPQNRIAETAAEPALRHALENGLLYFDRWVTLRAERDPKLATAVKVSFGDYNKPDDDTVYYACTRPITWDDFKDHPHYGKFAAEVLPGFGYDEQVEVKDGMISVHLDMKVFLPKSSCWVRDGAMSAYTLNHEQRHFDLVKVISERFKERVAALKLSVYNYDGPVNEAYLNAYHEMHELQEQYDHETDHGLNEGAQERWNDRIDTELKKYKVIPGGQI